MKTHCQLNAEKDATTACVRWKKQLRKLASGNLMTVIRKNRVNGVDFEENRRLPGHSWVHRLPAGMGIEEQNGRILTKVNREKGYRMDNS